MLDDDVDTGKQDETIPRVDGEIPGVGCIEEEIPGMGDTEGTPGVDNYATP